MKTIILITIAILFTINYGYSQQWNDEYGNPVIALTETNPWLMVIGSDVPTIAIYESGYVVYKRIQNKKMKYFSVKLDSTTSKDLFTI